MSSTDNKRIIKRKEFLPKWFSQKNYRGLETFSFDQWLQLLMERQLLFLNFKYQGGVRTLEMLGQTPELILGRPITQPPPIFDDSNLAHLVPISEEPDQSIEAEADQSELVAPPGSARIGNVRSLTFNDVNLFPLRIDLVKHEANIKKASNLKPEKYPEYKQMPYDKLMRDTGRYTDLIVHAVIDLASPDSKIINDFQTWLLGQRKMFNMKSIKECYSKSDRTKLWKNWRLLQTMDLYIWSEVEGIVISESLMTETVFENIKHAEIRDYRDVYRKSCKPEIERILTQQCYELFTNLAKPISVSRG